MVVLLNVSELHTRLSHLVNYSSQLIFVSGDSIADQQRTLSDFLSSRQDNTEISFFSASVSKQATDYRGAICRQLGGHEVGSFVRPLQQLLGVPKDGLVGTSPYLVCITQAEQLDPSFLQELWDWVMHSQQDNIGIHLNIILFGESNWAKSSQEWLPIQNSHKPVLLSRESINPVGFDVNALEALMADKSSWFSTSNQPLVTNKWFIGSILSVFLVVFVGLMAWQYPAQITSILNGNTELTSNSAITESQLHNDNSVTDRQAIVDTVDILDPQNINTETPAYLQLEVIEPLHGADILVDKIDAVFNEPVSSITNTLLVSNWSASVLAASTTLDEAKVINTLENPATIVNNDNTAIPISENSEQIQVAQTTVTASINKEGDFQVPDIISVEQLEAQLSNSSPVDFAVEIDPENSEPQTKAPIVQQLSIVDNSAVSYQFDETTLLSLPTNSIVLQLSGIQNPVVLQSYLTNNNMKDSTWVYETQRYGGPWFVVLYRQSFNSIDAALSQLSILPDNVRKAQPFAKSVNQIQQEISRR